MQLDERFVSGYVAHLASIGDQTPIELGCFAVACTIREQARARAQQLAGTRALFDRQTPSKAIDELGEFVCSCGTLRVCFERQEQLSKPSGVFSFAQQLEHDFDNARKFSSACAELHEPSARSKVTGQSSNRRS
jgi:hypothetical protein